MSKAVLKYYKAKPRKTRQLADMVRGRRVSEALVLLNLSARDASKDLEKLIRSALANATDRGENDDPDALIVQNVTVDEGPTMKRFRPRARGRTGRILKRTCHVQVVLDEPK
ncbi:MAG: 50S ribosomal protein L22 [Nitrospinaceae bacterium]|jgi:large subunit ribosomal protein L22|nr:50S ribosomal protein L22 [Nitrospinaceae bacterium]MBT3820248.1 50S ribosomal protein L22 [Nitrospinaceae bacterium]MBT4095021.1 50S ribosomal protein L22 [Nitrospinaceae bacterium]MBT4429783.1 50S ribosomal protein L22 [Nitrospinaceae bacterium]MBT5366548.1 50S ribosomal protein L22 [Nitrospinaceae bacterium]